MTQNDLETLKKLKGAELNEIIFGKDFVQIHFQGDTEEHFQTLTPGFGLTVENTEGLYKFPESGSRDALCALIGAYVEDFEVNRSSHIRLGFADRGRLVISLKGDKGPASLSSLFSVKRGELWHKAGLKPL